MSKYAYMYRAGKLFASCREFNRLDSENTKRIICVVIYTVALFVVECFIS